jgi:hypothetical protein
MNYLPIEFGVVSGVGCGDGVALNGSGKTPFTRERRLLDESVHSTKELPRKNVLFDKRIYLAKSVFTRLKRVLERNAYSRSQVRAGDQAVVVNIKTSI